MTRPTQAHGTCVAKGGAGVLLIGPPGSGKSDLALRLMSRGFELVADDQVLIENGVARAPGSLAGLLEVRGLGIMRVAHTPQASIALVVEPGHGDRMPEPRRSESLQDAGLDVPLVHIDLAASSAPERVALALDCALGHITQLAGAFVP